MTSTPRSIRAAITLFFVAPLLAEFLLGDFSIGMLGLLLLFAPMYGGGALLIREAARRSGRGWPSMLLLAAAYALIEEGFATQSLFNPHYLNLHLLSYAWIPALGIGAWWTIFVLNIHVFWSMGASIALVEGLFPAHAGVPWLGKTGTVITATLFVIGVAANIAAMRHLSPFHASAMQFAVTAVLSLFLVIAAFLLPRARQQVSRPGRSAWITGTVAFLLGAGILVTPPAWNWKACAIIFVIDCAFLIILGLLSRRPTWTPLHTLSIGCGAALVYGVHAFFQPPAVPSSPMVLLGSHILFLLLALGCIGLATLRTRAWITAAAPADTAAP